jgi:hypothetical protein
MLTNDDLKKIATLFDEKFEEKFEKKFEEKFEQKFEEKFEKKFKPIRKQLNRIEKAAKNPFVGESLSR